MSWAGKRFAWVRKASPGTFSTGPGGALDSKSAQVANLASLVDDIYSKLPRQRCVVRKVVGAMLVHIPFHASMQDVSPRDQVEKASEQAVIL